MEEPRAPDAPPPEGRKKRTEPYERKRPERVDVEHRQVYLGTVAFNDRDGNELETRRYVAPANEGPVFITERMLLDVRHARKLKPDINVGVVQDGAPELWHILRAGLEAEPSVDEWSEAIDRWHFNERLGIAARVIEPDAEQRKQKLQRWHDALDVDDDAIHVIHAELKDATARLLGDIEVEQDPTPHVDETLKVDETARAARRAHGRKRALVGGTANVDERANLDQQRVAGVDEQVGKRALTAEEATKLKEQLTFIENNHDRLRYASLLAKGLPVGSGATEGACKSVVALRAKRSGQRWHDNGIRAALTLRAVHLSERFHSFWNHLANLYTALVTPLPQVA